MRLISERKRVFQPPILSTHGKYGEVMEAKMIRSIAICATILLLAIAADTASPSSSAYALFGRSTSKQAISKACSDQANAKGLHGKARKTFRAKCKRHGGKPT
jgi:hypothetical protein